MWYHCQSQDPSSRKIKINLSLCSIFSRIYNCVRVNLIESAYDNDNKTINKVDAIIKMRTIKHISRFENDRYFVKPLLSREIRLRSPLARRPRVIIN